MLGEPAMAESGAGESGVGESGAGESGAGERPVQAERGADPEAVARAVVLDRLSRAPRTRAQLVEALRKRGVPDEPVRAVLDRFEEVGLVDDPAFAAAWVESRHTGRGLARRALAHELRHRGVAPETVAAAVERLGPEQEEATARALVRSRLPAIARLESPVRMRRLVGVLARKGYPQGLALRVVREELAEHGSAAEDARPVETS